ncbi:MAG TPA: peroxiredoxin [Sedimentisphaerales bacterium]|nr:peroxiredoxin [Sedimentisphaerales bacterium]
MKHKRWTSMALLALFICGCGTHKVEVQPIKVQPIQLTLDINVKMQQEQIESAASELSPVVGNPAPDFTLVDQNKQPVTLSNYRGKWVVLYFYPKDDTPGCTIEAKDFTALLPRFRQMNTEILGISNDSPKSHCDFIDKHELQVRLLSDPKHEVMKLYGAWVRSSLGNLSYGRVIRTTMIVDSDSAIRHYWPEVIAQGHAERVLKKLAELQGRSLNNYDTGG